MERYTPTKIAGSIAGIAQAVGNAMNGQTWLAYVWAGAGLVLGSEVFWHARWVQQKLSKRWKITTIVAMWVVIVLAVRAAIAYPNIKLETGRDLVSINSGGYKFVEVRVHNAGPNIAQCNIYLTELRKDGKTFEGFTNTTIVLGAKNQDEPEQWGAQGIPPRTSRDFELFYMFNNEFHLYGKRLQQLPTAPSAPGEYVESIQASGVNCGPALKTYVIKYAGGFDATWHEKDSRNTWLPSWLRRQQPK
jgi:hypothetical protein